ncbi:phosphoprotein phosphatase methylesterase 1 [Rhodotorula paludigena]|uniref:phosphoprotein phosphatase methylesterase 1 n=1 Tax=Rhodotorula paludigena TaxID=86838 RepID=UPI00316E8EF3
MQRDLLKSRLSRLPQLPALDPPGGEVEELDADEAAEALDSFDPTAPAVRTSRRRIGALASSPAASAQYAPLSAEGSFAEALEVDVPVQNVWAGTVGASTAQFRVYYTPPPAPTTMGGGADADDAHEAGGPGGNGVVFVCVHGAGYSALSFAELAKQLVEPDEDGRARGRIGVLAYDARGHGKTRLPDLADGAEGGKVVDMSLENLGADLVSLLRTLFPDRRTAPALVLVGHSMGGAVVAEACNTIQKEVTDVTGVAVVDVVEGTAIEALPGMAALVAGLPQSFDSQADAIAWHVHSRTINNLASARISVPPLIRPADPAAAAGSEGPYVWRARLAETEPYWRGWFTGLSNKFLGCRAAKLLLLAGTDRLDKELLIGQMQGKYQLEVYPDVGHCVHEDAPERTAETLLSFWERNDRTDVLRGVKKVGEA